MSKASALLLVSALAASSALVPAFGQSVISAHSGTIQFTEGQVNLNGTAVQPKFGEFPDVKTDGVLSTADGRAEVLLTPGVFLRIGENSSFKMVSNQLSNTRLEIQSGQAMVQVSELLADNSITVAFHGADVSLSKSGLYRFDADTDPAKLRVYEGEASVVSPSSDPLVVRKGHEIEFGAAKLEAKTFDTKATDEFYRWNARRDEYIAQANIVAAKTARDSGTGTGFANSGYGSGLGYGGGLGYGNGLGMGMGSWAFNPWLGMFTYLPMSGTYFSPFGFGYFSPYAVGYLYGPYSPYYSGNGYPNSGTMLGSNGGLTRATTAAPTTATTLNRAAGLNGGLGSAGPSSSTGTSTRGGSSLSSGGGLTGGSTSHASAGGKH